MFSNPYDTATLTGGICWVQVDPPPHTHTHRALTQPPNLTDRLHLHNVTNWIRRLNNVLLFSPLANVLSVCFFSDVSVYFWLLLPLNHTVKNAHCFWSENRARGREKKQWKIEVEKRDGIKRERRDWWRRQRRREMILGTPSDFSPGEAHEPTSANTCRFLFSMHLLSAQCFILGSYNGAVNHSWQVRSSRRPSTPLKERQTMVRKVELLKAEMSVLSKRSRNTVSVSVWTWLCGLEMYYMD